MSKTEEGSICPAKTQGYIMRQRDQQEPSAKGAPSSRECKEAGSYSRGGKAESNQGYSGRQGLGPQDPGLPLVFQ